MDMNFLACCSVALILKYDVVVGHVGVGMENARGGGGGYSVRNAKSIVIDVQGVTALSGKSKSAIVGRFNQRLVAQAYYDVRMRIHNAELFCARRRCLLEVDTEPHGYCMPPVCPSVQALQVLEDELIRRCEFSDNGRMLCMLFDNGIKSLEWDFDKKVWQLADNIRVNINDGEGLPVVTPLAIYFTLTVTDVINARGRRIGKLGNYRVCAQALQKAACCGCLSVIKTLVKAGVSPDLVNDSGELTAFQLAIMSNQISMAHYLIRHGADVNRLEPGLERITPVQRAAMNGQANIIQLLIRCGADYEAANVVGESPLFHAIRSHDLDSVDVLLNGNSACDVVTNRKIGEFPPFSVDYGAAPIHVAVHEGDCSIIKRLLQHGVNINIRTKGWRYTALKKAFWGETHGDPVKVMALLLRYRALINVDDIFFHSEKSLTDDQRRRSVLLLLAARLFQRDVGRALANTLDGRMLSVPAQSSRLNVNSLHALAAQRIWVSLWHSMGLE